MTYHELIEAYDFAPTKPDLRARVARAIVDGWTTLVACTGDPKPFITWTCYSQDAPLWIGNFAFRHEGEAEEFGESIVATRRKGVPS
jgi:hypothetical protein